MQRKYRTRSDLIGAVQCGRLTRGKAEKLATRLGMPPLEYCDWTKHDPRLLSRWSLAMTLAWIAWREFKCVAEFDRDYLARFAKWSKAVRPVPSTHLAERTRHVFVLHYSPEPFVTSCHVRCLLAEDDGALCGAKPVERAPWAALRAAAADGEVTAEAVPYGSPAPREIPSIDWSRLEAEFSADLREEVLVFQPTDTILRSSPAYEAVSFRANEVMKAWPERGRPFAASGCKAVTPSIREEFRNLAKTHCEQVGTPPDQPTWERWRRELGISRDEARKLQQGWPQEYRRRVGGSRQSAGK